MSAARMRRRLQQRRRGEEAEVFFSADVRREIKGGTLGTRGGEQILKTKKMLFPKFVFFMSDGILHTMQWFLLGVTLS